MSTFVAVLVAILLSSTSSITFPGTSNSNLVVLNNKAYDDGKSIRNIDELIRQTPSFINKYGPPTFPNDSGESTLIPNVVLIRGSNEDSFGSSKSPALSTNTGLIGSVLTAYNTHQNLQFRPDDIWITILAQFSAFVNARAEELREKFVSHKGQKELEIYSGGNIYSADFGDFNLQFLDKISENIKNASLREWFLPGFSTSSVVDNVIAAAMAMCSLQAYFSYKIHFVCGIPEITLLGTVNDWKILRQKVEKLVDFDDAKNTMSEIWVPLLRTILDNFVESAQHGSKSNIKFWNSIASHRTVMGCSPTNYLTGWISTFSIFNNDGEIYANMNSTYGSPWPELDVDDINHNIAACPVSIDDNGIPYNATLFVGQMSYDFVVDKNSTNYLPSSVKSVNTTDNKMRILKPRNDWALVIANGFEEYIFPKEETRVHQGPQDVIPIVIVACLGMVWLGFNKMRRRSSQDASLKDHLYSQKPTDDTAIEMS